MSDSFAAYEPDGSARSPLSAGHVLDLSSADRQLSAHHGALFVDGERVYALADTLCVFVGPKVRMTGSVPLALARHDVVMVNVDGLGRPLAFNTALPGGFRIASRHRAQRDLSLPRRKSAWQAIVVAKIDGQYAVSRTERLRVLATKVRSGDPEKVEAQAAREHWAAIRREVGQADWRRTMQGAEDDLNSRLNYGYAVVRTAMLRAVLACGLWPALGIEHQHRENPTPLVDDLIEPFRPAVDRQALACLDAMSDSEWKHSMVDVLTSSFATHSTHAEINAFAQQFARYVEGHHERLDPPSLQT